jgi:arylsulfatase A-like enzyme
MWTLALSVWLGAACRGPDLVELPCDPDAAPTELSAPALSFSGERPKNLLMVSLDTLRRDRVGRYDGSDRTDFLDSLFERGVALDDHRSCSNWTYPGMLCALTGQGPLDLGFIPMTNLGDEPESVPERISFLGDWLGQAGYTTELVTANSLIGEKFGFARAYQTIEEHSGHPAATINSYAFSALAELRDQEQPWFLHVHYLDPHIPYDPPDEYLGGLEELPPLDDEVYLKGVLVGVDEDLDDYSQEELDLIKAHLAVRYNGELAYLDDELEALFSTLEAYDILEDTLVVLYSDHGEQFWDHGEILHHSGIYQEESDAIALFVGPGLTPLAWSEPTTHADLVPTILDALQIDIPQEVTGAVLGTEPSCARFVEHLDPDSGAQSVDYGPWRMVYDWGGEVRLYDREAAPGEREDLLADYPDEALLLWSFLFPRVEALGALHPDAAPDRPRL